MSQGIEAQFGLRVPVVLRSAEEMLHVYFLAEAPSATQVSRLNQERSPGDTFVVRGREIYLHLPGGVASTKLFKMYFDKAPGTVSTLRSWRTVGALAGMMDAG